MKAPVFAAHTGVRYARICAAVSLCSADLDVIFELSIIDLGGIALRLIVRSNFRALEC